MFAEVEKAMKDSLRLVESKWTVRLSHHYLSKLAVNPSYIIDNHDQIQFNSCDCCNQSIQGQYGDTSIGMYEARLAKCGQIIFAMPVAFSGNTVKTLYNVTR